MTWLKHVWLDFVVTAIIIVATVWEPSWAVWVVLIYTPIMLVLKIIPLAGGLVQRQLRQTTSRAPSWFYHVLYAVNTGFLLLFGWWATGAAWLGIWLLSAIARRRTETP